MNDLKSKDAFKALAGTWPFAIAVCLLGLLITTSILSFYFGHIAIGVLLVTAAILYALAFVYAVYILVEVMKFIHQILSLLFRPFFGV